MKNYVPNRRHIQKYFNTYFYHLKNGQNGFITNKDVIGLDLIPNLTYKF